MSPALTTMVAKMLLSPEGRHKLYASCIHPLLNRLGASGCQALVVPEPVFWRVVQDRAAALHYPGCLGYFFGADEDFWPLLKEHPRLVQSMHDAFDQVLHAAPGPEHPLVGVI